MEIPKAYEEREQSLLKHRVLREYLIAWAMKLGSIKSSRGVRLCYVDGFAGPWNAVDDDLSDTSSTVALEALNDAANKLATGSSRVTMDAVFIEKDPKRFARLDAVTRAAAGVVKVTTLAGEFGENVASVKTWLANVPVPGFK